MNPLVRMAWTTPERLPPDLAERYRASAARVIAATGHPPRLVVLELAKQNLIVAVALDERDGHTWVNAAIITARELGLQVVEGDDTPDPRGN